MPTASERIRAARNATEIALGPITKAQERALFAACSGDTRVYGIEYDGKNLTLVYAIGLDYFRDVVGADGATLMTGVLDGLTGVARAIRRDL